MESLRRCRACRYGGGVRGGGDRSRLAFFFFESGANQADNQNLLRAGWASIYRAFSEARREVSRNERDAWFPIVRQVRAHGGLFEHLPDQAALNAEGAALAPRIATYGQWFANDLARPFSAREAHSGCRRATLVVHEKGPGRWDIFDIKGRENAEVGTSMVEAAQSVVRSIEGAIARDKQDASGAARYVTEVEASNVTRWRSDYGETVRHALRSRKVPRCAKANRKAVVEAMPQCLGTSTTSRSEATSSDAALKPRFRLRSPASRGDSAADACRHHRSGMGAPPADPARSA